MKDVEGRSAAIVVVVIVLPRVVFGRPRSSSDRSRSMIGSHDRGVLSVMPHLNLPACLRLPDRGSSLLLPSMSPKDEESPADYNNGGYLQVKVSDSFKDGRYSIVRKLGCVPFPFFLRRPR